MVAADLMRLVVVAFVLSWCVLPAAEAFAVFSPKVGSQVLHRRAPLQCRAPCLRTQSKRDTSGAVMMTGEDQTSTQTPFQVRTIRRFEREGGMLENHVREPFVADGELVPERAVIKQGTQPEEQYAFLRAGPRAEIAFSGKETKIGIVTCGGLCPGLNNVVREIAREATACYKVPVGNVLGIRNGFRGFTEDDLEPFVLSPDFVENIHDVGGSVLGSARGGFDAEKIIKSAEKMGLNMLFIIGGDGTHAAAMKLDEEAQARGLRISVVGIPKTIDNDIKLIDRSFGFDTAVQEAVHAIKCAKAEALASLNGVGVVRLMGRHCGFLTAYASLASNDVDLCLIPEAPFEVDQVVDYVRDTLKLKGHMIITIAEGTEAPSDASHDDSSAASSGDDVGMAGTSSIQEDIGRWLVDTLNARFEGEVDAPSIKYIDPSYMVRSVAANVGDAQYCALLASQAVHGAFAGYSGFTVGLINNKTVLIPMAMIAGQSRRVDPTGRFWFRVLAATQQPSLS